MLAPGLHAGGRNDPDLGVDFDLIHVATKTSPDSPAVKIRNSRAEPGWISTSRNLPMNSGISA